jgi:hypothetical protein
LNPEPYIAPWWLPGGNLQTIYARTLARNYAVEYQRQRWETPDGDFIDLDWLNRQSGAAKLLVLFHGLEGCSRSHYALSVMAMAQKFGWHGVVPHFRGCSGEINRLARAYHSGDAAEIDWILGRLKRENPDCEIYVIGVSLGGNMLLKWLGEQGAAATTVLTGAMARPSINTTNVRASTGPIPDSTTVMNGASGLDTRRVTPVVLLGGSKAPQ